MRSTSRAGRTDLLASWCIPMGDREPKQDIAEVLIRYSTGIDRRDWDAFRSCFTADCHADYGADIGIWNDVDSITEFMIESHAEMGQTMHRLSDIAVTVDGGRATPRTY